uniref:Uncharacterized protein n=1 Tax=Anguilla anguilla TaxID=7936 RepID=A0A0E9WNN0_ANGAN
MNIFLYLCGFGDGVLTACCQLALCHESCGEESPEDVILNRGPEFK